MTDDGGLNHWLAREAERLQREARLRLPTADELLGLAKPPPLPEKKVYTEEDRKAWRRKAGIARSEKLTAEERSAISRKAAAARWKRNDKP